MTDYSRGDYADLPAGKTDLENDYSAPDLTAIASNDNSTYAEQTANNEIAIHQYKKTVTSQYTNITWSGKSSLAPSESPVIMEVYNVTGTPAWEELDRDDSTAADTDFDIIHNNLATADYLDSGVITWRVWQAASGPSYSWTWGLPASSALTPKDGSWYSLNSLITFNDSDWQTCTLTTDYVPSDTTAILLAVNNNSGTEISLNCSFKSYNSTDNRVGLLSFPFQSYILVPVNSLKFKTWCAHADLQVYLVGSCNYPYFKDNADDVSTGTISSYQQTDLGSYGIASGSQGAWFELRHNDVGNYIAFYIRDPNHTGNTLVNQQIRSSQRFAFSGVGHVDLVGDYVFEQQISSTNLDLYYIGYGKSEVVELATPVRKNLASGSGAWNDCDCSGDVPAGTNAVILQIKNLSESSSKRILVRVNGSSLDLSAAVGWELAQYGGGTFAIVGLDGDGIFEAMTADSDPTMAGVYVVGYISPS